MLARLSLLLVFAGAAQAAVWERLFVIWFENNAFSKVLKDQFWSHIASGGMLLTNYSAVAHPSQPNYVSWVAGDMFNIKDNNNYDLDPSIETIVDRLEEFQVSWKTYQEGYVPLADGNCNMAKTIGRYARKHCGFLSFRSTTDRLDRCKKIVPSTQLDIDIANNALPEFSFFTPDLDNDGHDTSIEFAGRWFQHFLDKYMNMPNFRRNTMVLATWDEDDRLENNHVYAVLLGDYVTRRGSKDDTVYTHYSTTKTIIENWDLDLLGRNELHANSMIDAWAKIHGVNVTRATRL